MGEEERLKQISSRMWGYLSEPQPEIVKKKKNLKKWGIGSNRWEKYGDCLVTLSIERIRHIWS